MGENTSWTRRQIRKYSEEEIIEYLKRRAKLLRHTPTVTDLNKDKDGPGKIQILKYFPSYEAAIEAAGLEPLPKPWSKYSDDELIELAKEWHKGHPNGILNSFMINNNPDLPPYSVIYKRFGNMEKYFKLTGVPYEYNASFWRK